MTPLRWSLNFGIVMQIFRFILMMLALTSLTLGVGCSDDDDDMDTGADQGAAGTDGDSMGDGDGDASGDGDGDVAGDGDGDAEPGDGDGDAEPLDIIETALAAGDFTALADALTAADLVDALQGEGPFTVFAPNDAAFEAFEEENPGVLDSLSVEELTAILTYHVISGAAVMSTDLENGQLAETLAGPVLAVDLSGDAPMINEASVVTADIEASNGVIHVIDTIILPPGDIIEVATAAGSFETLAGALTDANLVETLQGEGPFTVFAPTDAAFEALDAIPEGDALAAVLTYHVLSGIAGPLDLADGGVATTVNGAPMLFDLSEGAKVVGGGESSAMITTTNVVASNGVIHVIDAVILPPADDIVATAVAAGSFETLAGALTSQDLVETLQGDGPFTVFAPTDDAFGLLDAIPEGDALTDVLLYHVADGAVGAGNLADGEVEMLNGDSVTVDLSDGVKINDSGVSTANILTSNGVIHVIDAVLIPPSE